jgi:hypothetical protein
MMPDMGAEEAELEMIRLVGEVQNKWHVSNQTMNYFLACMAQDYGIRAVVERNLNEEEPLGRG